MPILGIFFAVAALLSWTFGDFFIQKAVRLVGDFKALFYIGIVGIIGILPFILRELPELFEAPSSVLLLTLTGIVIFFAALFNFEALKRGKMAVIEPILGMELPITIALSILFWNERPSLSQYLLMAGAFVGIVLAITAHHAHLHYHRKILEKGVIFAGVGSVIMGLVNFLVGASSQTTSPLMAIWFSNLVFTALCVIYMVARKEMGGIVRDIKNHGRIILAESVLDNAAWIFFAFAASLIPISIATTVSESYIALAVLLGIFVNGEKIRWHQKLGIALAIASIILISAITS